MVYQYTVLHSTASRTNSSYKQICILRAYFSFSWVLRFPGRYVFLVQSFEKHANKVLLYFHWCTYHWQDHCESTFVTKLGLDTQSSVAPLLSWGRPFSPACDEDSQLLTRKQSHAFYWHTSPPFKSWKLATFYVMSRSNSCARVTVNIAMVFHYLNFMLASTWKSKFDCEPALILFGTLQVTWSHEGIGRDILGVPCWTRRAIFHPIEYKFPAGRNCDDSGNEVYSLQYQLAYQVLLFTHYALFARSLVLVGLSYPLS